MKRRFDPRTKIHGRWRCQRSDCRKLVAITDEVMLTEITELLEYLSKHPEKIQLPSEEGSINLEALRVENSVKFRKKLPDAADCKRSNKSAQKPSLANTPRNTLLQSCLSAESAERRIADAHGRLAVISESYGDASTDWITAKSTATILRRCLKMTCREP